MPSYVPWTLAAISRQAHRQGTKIAVADDTGDISYGQLWRDAGRLAAGLRSRGLHPGDVVAVAARRGTPFVVAALGAWRVGCAFLPFEMLNPASRLRAIVDDAKPALLVTSPPFDGSGDDLGVTELRLPDTGTEGEAAELEPSAANDSRSEDPLAYVMYTSGTSGTPKGVMVGHAALANLSRWFLTTYSITAADRALHTAGLGFDVSILELWPYLAAGATVVTCGDEHRLLPDAIVAQLAHHRCTTAFLPTPVAEATMAYGIALEGFRYLVTGGDRLRLPIPAPDTYQLINGYGPTEATVFATAHDVVTGKPGDLPPIGRPVDNVTAVLCDPSGVEVPPGEIGELYIGGAGLAHGYLGKPELTTQRFVDLPGRAGRWYRTGDQASWDRDALLFHGRIDREQLKVNGVRVESGELEAALLGLDGVASAAVVLADGDPGRAAEELVAVLVVRGEQPGPRLLRRALASRLPAYLIPRRFVFTERLPLTANGKLDRPAVAELVRAEGGGHAR